MPIALGLFVGLVMGLSGAGGSILAIPLLAIGLGLSLTEAAPISLLAIMAASLTGAIQGLYRGNVRYKAALLIGTFGIIITPIGVWLAKRAPTEALSLILACIMLYVAWRMWHQHKQDALNQQDKAPPPCEINPATSKLFWTAFCTKRLITTGLISGLLSGLLGVGGGFVIVPALKIATSLAIISLVSAGSVAIHLHQGNINWPIAIPFVLSAMLSMVASSVINHLISAKVSQRIFSIIAVTCALIMLAKLIL